MGEWQTLMQAGDPTSPAAQDMARRWTTFATQFTARGVDVSSKSKAIWQDAMTDPATAEKLMLYRETSRFADQAIAHSKTLTK